MAAPAVEDDGGRVKQASPAYLESKAVKETRVLIADLCKQFYNLGWVSGTGGSITVKVHDDCVSKPDQLILMSPSGVQKERMEPEDMYVLASDGSILSTPSPKPFPHKAPKCSDCAPLFLKAYNMRDAGAVMHSHGMESCLVTMLNPSSKEFRITHMEMIKGIKGHGYYDELVVPIIENTAYENELTDSLAKAIEAYPKATAVLVRNHGLYVWGDSWISAKTQAECYHYLFDAAIKLHRLGLDWTTPEHGPIQNTREIMGSNGHLNSSFKIKDDLANGIGGAVPIPPSNKGKEAVVGALVTNIEAMIRADRKIKALKQLQGHIWRTGFENNQLEGVVYEDVPVALEKWNALGIKVYIYSSGSRLAQRLLFGKTKYGDLRHHLSGFFDTMVGNKRETRSYIEIAESLGVDRPSEILFLTDVYQEAAAAKAAGLDVAISIRPGNAPLPENHEFKTIKSFLDL